MSQAKLSVERTQRLLGRYAPLNAPRARLGREHRRSSLRLSPNMVLKRQQFRPSDMNLMLGRVEHAQKRATLVVDKPKVEAMPPPAPKGRGKGNAFKATSYETFAPPPPYGQGFGRPTAVGSLSIGGLRAPEQ